MATESNRPAILSSGTLVPLGAFLLFAAGGWQTYDSLRTTIRDGVQQNRDDIRDVKEDVRALRTEINTKTDDRWRKTDMKLWSLKLQQAFPDKAIPAVD